MTDPYLSVDAFKTRARITDVDQDEAIAAVLRSASRQVDNWCGRYFGLTEFPEDRYFTATPRSALSLGDQWYGIDVDDMAEVEAITTLSLAGAASGLYLDVWDADDYELQEAWGVPKGQAPYGRIVPSVRTLRAFPLDRHGVRVTARWGWPQPPAPVVEVVYLMANRLKSLWDAPFGVAGSGEMGQLQMATSLTPILKEMLAPYRILTV